METKENKEPEVWEESLESLKRITRIMQKEQEKLKENGKKQNTRDK